MQRSDRSYEGLVAHLLLESLSDNGVNPQKRGRRTRGEMEIAVAERLWGSMGGLNFEPSKMASNKDQFSLGLGALKSRRTPEASLRMILKKKSRPRRRDVEIFLPEILELTLKLAGALALRGFRGVSENKVLQRFKLEVEWVLCEYGYILPHSRVCHCPFLVDWTEYPIWIPLSRLDGLSSHGANEIRRRQRRRSRIVGCPGYSCSPPSDQLGFTNELNLVTA